MMGNQATNLRYYVPSLRVPGIAIPVAILCSLVSLPGALFYAWLDASLPPGSVVLHLFALVGFACWLALLAWIAARTAKVRNPRWMGWTGLSIGLVGWYCQWAAYAMFALSGSQPSAATLWGTFSAIATHPLQMVGMITGPAAEAIAGGPVLTGLRVLAWLAELLLLVVVPCLVAENSAAQPFCEATNVWAEAIPLPHRFACIESPADAVKRLEADPELVFSILTAAVDDDRASYWKAVLYRCPGGDLYLTLRRAKQPDSASNKTREGPLLLVDLLKLPSADPDEVIRKFAQAAQHVPTPPELQSAVEDLEAGRYQAALDAAAPHMSASRFGLRIDALRLAGLANARLEKWSDSRQCWLRLYTDVPTARHALEVATSSVMAGEVARGEQWVAKALELNSAEPTVPGITILTNFLTALTQTGQMKVAFPYLEQVKECYESLSITDSHFLWTRGVPFFETFLEKSAVIVRAVLDPEQAHAWYASMLPRLDENGRQQLSEWLRTWCTETVGE
jgi:hypothetical protein